MPYLKPQRHPKLKPEDLKWTCGEDCFDFETTDSLKPIEGIVGQERALKALKIGVDIKSQGYNVFVTGLSGTGKFTTIKKTLEAMRPECPQLFDYAYVNNFKDADRPRLLTFKAGEVRKFRDDLKNAIQFLQENIPTILEGEPFLTNKNKLISKFASTQQKLMKEFETRLNKDELTLGQIKVGEVSRPEILAVIDGEPVFIPQLEEKIKEKKITKTKANKIVKKYTIYHEELQIIFRKSLKINQDFKQAAQDLEKNTVLDLIKAALDYVDSKYEDKAIKEFINDLTEDIVDNLEVFKGQRPAQERTEEGLVIDYLRDYDVNILLDNSAVKECPIVIETSPTFSNLFGVIEKNYDPSGGWFSDFKGIKAGALLRANGGYLVINALDSFNEPGVWRTLKRVLLYGKLEILDTSASSQFSPSILKPEPINVNTKIIFIGNNYIYSLLSQNEDDFNKIFKIKAEFDYEMKLTKNAMHEYAGVVKKLVMAENLLEFNKSGLAKIIEYGIRYAGEKDKLTTRFAYIADLVREASFWANDDGESIVGDYHVQQAYKSVIERHGLQESKLNEMIRNNTILLATDGLRVGQINGLAVYSGGKYSFGKPTRITASVSLGEGDIINVEREAGLSGSTHNKGVLIINGYFREKFGKKIPLSFSASLVFEQGYGMIDGDSASITEICVLLSSIADIPINQSFAITGSVNQKGDIQPIGGVNEKIEGFFDLCNSRGLTKKNAVIIPVQNVKDLMLKDEVVEAVKEKKFSIYSISKVEEAVELLMGVKAGAPNKNGSYPANTVFGIVERKLKEMRDLVKTPVKSTKTRTKNSGRKK